MDSDQSIKMLTDDVRRLCLGNEPSESPHTSQNLDSTQVFVPQFRVVKWGSNNIITQDGIGEAELTGRSIKWRDHEERERHRQRENQVVRISYVIHGNVLRKSYPLEHCASWFDLLNKHQNIQRLYGEPRRRNGSKGLRLFIDDELITERTWIPLRKLKLLNSETVDVWVRSSAQDLSVDSAPEISTESGPSFDDGFGKPTKLSIQEDMKS
ncbi:hypothetical protein MMC21_006814, partial [Puttea exsequens]|nr:hypothetical protein [Puttea exsequens]